MLQFTFGLPAPKPRKSVLCCEQVNIVGNGYAAKSTEKTRRVALTNFRCLPR